MSAICQVPLVCLPSSVTMWRHFSPRLDKLLPLAALYFCPVRLPTDSRISTSGASEGGAHESDAPESMTVVIFLHPLLVSVLHHLSDTRGCMSISTGSAINGFRDDLMGVIGTSNRILRGKKPGGPVNLLASKLNMADDVEEPPFQSNSFSGTVSNQYMPLLPLPPFPPLLSIPFPDDFPLVQL